VETLKNGEEFLGNRTRVKVVKNKVAPPFKTAEFDIMFGTGISREGDVLDLATKLDIIDKSGTWYAYKDSKIGQGKENSKNFLKENPEIKAEIEAKDKEMITPAVLGSGSEEDIEDISEDEEIVLENDEAKIAIEV
jgi:recombination protein RecA